MRFCMARRICVTSGKGGVGKTTIVSSLGVTLAKMGYKTLLVDMDFGLNNLDVIMGIENKIVYDIIDVLEGKCLPKQALVQDFLISDLYVFPSTHGFSKVRFGAKELSFIISQLDNFFDYILIDCPAGIDGGFRRAVDSACEHIVVTTPHVSAIRDADKIINTLKSKQIYIIINRVRGDLILDYKMLSVKSICDLLSGELLGVVPEDDNVTLQTLTLDRFDKNCPIQVSLDMMAKKLTTGSGEVFDCTKKYQGLLGSIRKKLRSKV